LASYDALRDQLPDDGTSRLSPYLHFGCLSPATVLARSHRRAHDDSFARQLCWRDFHHQVLAARPDLPHADYRPRSDRWRRDPHALEAWQRGLTGYPIVDAGMRQLQIEGFMHNRARLIVASCRRAADAAPADPVPVLVLELARVQRDPTDR
jgi:deoxyribodipyrimidine photo-lyase